MRKCLLIVLLLVMPLQLCWAAVGSYCLHAADSSSHHLGHHEHGSEPGVQGLSPSNSADQDTDADAHCAACHAAGVAIIVGVPALPAAAHSPRGNSAYRHSATTPPSERPDRPQWPRLASSAG